MKNKFFILSLLASMLIISGIFMSFTNAKSNSLNQRTCVREYKVTITSLSAIPTGSTGVVRLTFSDGTIKDKTFNPANPFYEFGEYESYPQVVCASLVLNIGSSTGNECKLISSRPPCGTIASMTILGSSFASPIE